MIQTGNEIKAEDIVCIVLYCLTNFALTGIFRVLMVFVDWKPWEIIVYKVGIIASSIAYVIVGLIYLSGNDQVSNQIDDFEDGVVKLIEELIWTQSWSEEGVFDPFYLIITMYLNR